jgi:hypothetical protein
MAKMEDFKLLIDSICDIIESESDVYPTHPDRVARIYAVTYAVDMEMARRMSAQRERERDDK